MKLLFAALALAHPLADGPATTVADRAVMTGLDGADLDACGGVGRINAFGLREDEGRPLRAAPDGNAAKAGEVAGGALVWLCEGDGDWQGIVYPADDLQELGDCRVSSPLPAPEPYAGPCRSGWVEARHIQLIAG